MHLPQQKPLTPTGESRLGINLQQHRVLGVLLCVFIVGGDVAVAARWWGVGIENAAALGADLWGFGCPGPDIERGEDGDGVREPGVGGVLGGVAW